MINNFPCRHIIIVYVINTILATTSTPDIDASAIQKAYISISSTKIPDDLNVFFTNPNKNANWSFVILPVRKLGYISSDTFWKCTSSTIISSVVASVVATVVASVVVSVVTTYFSILPDPATRLNIKPKDIPNNNFFFNTNSNLSICITYSTYIKSFSV